MLVKTILNRCHHSESFVYGRVAWEGERLTIDVAPRKGSRARCGICGKRGPTYDTSKTARFFEFVPLWGFAVFLLYMMRRVDCRSCGVTTERVPWADGKNQTCNAYRLFLARWARRMSWGEVAHSFNVSWGVVYRAIRWVVDYGLAHRSLDGVEAMGVDEMAVWSGHRYVTVVYQIDEGMRRLLWIGSERTEKTLEGFFTLFGKARAASLYFVASDMWKPYLKVVAAWAPQAIHVLDRFHVVAKLHKAVDEVRAKEARELASRGMGDILKHTRWCLLKNTENLTETQGLKLAEILRYNLRAVRAWLLKDAFNLFWTYNSPRWAGWFLDLWCKRAMRSRLDPIKQFAKTVRAHRELLLNWFVARKTISSGVVEALNGNAKLAVRRARGFRSFKVLETALYHYLGKLPEPKCAHRFC
jgi:transposase